MINLEKQRARLKRKGNNQEDKRLIRRSTSCMPNPRRLRAYDCWGVTAGSAARGGEFGAAWASLDRGHERKEEGGEGLLCSAYLQ